MTIDHEKYKIQAVRVLKLSTAETIICYHNTFRDAKDGTLQHKIKYPISIYPKMRPDGRYDVGMVPWLPFFDNYETELPDTFVMCLGGAAEDQKRQFLEATTGLSMATESDLKEIENTVNPTLILE